MRLRDAGITVTTLLALSAQGAWAQSLSGVAATPPGLITQSTDSTGSMASQDSILQPRSDPYVALSALEAKQRAVQAAETNLNISLSAMHTQYHENATPGTGDDENGYSGGGGVGASVLLPQPGLFRDAALYSAMSLNLSAGNLRYGGHYLASGLPVDATDRAVFLRIEGRLGMGFALSQGMELIPFLAGGYQSWNRNIDRRGQIGTDEQYTTGLLGAGVKLDVPVTQRLVLSGTAEMLALFAGHIVANGVGFNHGLGGSAEERVALGTDYAIQGPLHGFLSLNWEHFNYAGSKPTLSSGGFYEPLSTTTQFGVNVGAAYSF